VYGHHHPDHLREAANAIGSRKPVSLVISLVKARKQREQVAQAIENTGGGRSRSRTGLRFPNSLLTGKLTGILLEIVHSVRF
jgi:hypothetical protein